MSLYSRRGVSAQKEEVHYAVKDLYQGLYKKAFCKVYPDYLTDNDDYVNIMHADGAGTKSILAYLYWKETGDISVWRGIAQDAIVMNLDDLICVGVYDKILFSSTIDRNKNLIPADVLKEIIDGSEEFFELMRSCGVNIYYMGGETADVGDVVRTIAVNGTMTGRWPKSGIVTNEKIRPGDVIVGLASYGKAIYEKEYNSGIASNGLTSARHDILENYYAQHFPESYDPSLSDDVVYIGKHRINDIKEILSPTRTFAPVMKQILKKHFDDVHGLIHCSGGGQTKCLKYVPDFVRIVKKDLFEVPPIFNKIKEASGVGNHEMYQVFNMGCRMEIYTPENKAAEIMDIADTFEIEAKIIGKVESSEEKELIIECADEILYYQ
ncbi:MAG: phosphoribosylformylglycinamidine cyclo-ligase [Chitinophagaceae bacterium]|nr:phosphoribosylformylglycinamidine cyclo-ligase [Chitinophagaceae bacterium]MCZ2397278.1 phosphoribosylformylglycinamidine cyclo-ligase [Chitinophagales bacterium]